MPPAISRDTWQRLYNFTHKWLRENLKPLEAGDIMGFEEWIEQTNYTESRRNELRAERERVLGMDVCLRKNKLTKLKGFIKRETYMKYKEARGINSRSDAFKIWAGPFVASIEKKVFDLPYFIKHISVRDRPRYIMEHIGHGPGPFYASDFSHFESHFVPEMIEAVEGQLYEYMLGRLLCGSAYSQVLQDMNVIDYHDFTIKVRGVRMSGEMSTSLGNGFTNLMIWMFIADEKGLLFNGVVEGDDGLFAQLKGSGEVAAADFANCGFEVKLEKHLSVLTASFCGISMSEDLCALTDPRKVILNVGWSHSPQAGPSLRVRRELLRAKALSLLYEHPRCPILSRLAYRLIETTQNHSARFDSNWYEKTLAVETVAYTGWAFEQYSMGVSQLARAQFEELYGITISEQIRLEADLVNWRGEELPESFASLFSSEEYDDCRAYFETLVTRYGVEIY